jgi:mycothiol synthase
MMETTQTLPNTTALENYLIRPIGPEDGQAINRMLLEIEAVDHRDIIDTMEDRQRDFHDPDTDPATDSILVLTPDSQAAGMGWIFTPREADQEYVAFLWGEVHPEHRRRGLGDMILTWLEDRASQILSTKPVDRPRTLRAAIMDELDDRIELFEQHGFRAVRSFYRMQRDLQLPIGQPVLPITCTLAAWDASREDEVLAVMNEAFRDHWGFIPMSKELWRLWVTDHEDFRPDLSFIVLSTETGEIVGTSVNKVNQAENEARGIREGWIMDLCIRRPWRKQGLATALLNASMLAFKANELETAGLGVDTENLTGALRLYERLGFQPVKRTYSYTKAVPLE